MYKDKTIKGNSFKKKTHNNREKLKNLKVFL